MLESGHLVISDNSGQFRKISIEKQKVVREFKKLDEKILAVCMTSNEKMMFVSTNNGLKLVSTYDGRVINDFGRIHGEDVIRMFLTEDDNLFN